MKAVRHVAIAHVLRVLVLSIVVLAVGGCAAEAPERSYADRVWQHRVERDMQMREDGSVLPRAARAQFRGLQYFDVDTSYRFTLPLQPAVRPDTVLMAGSAGEVVPQERLGEVAVPFPGGEHVLTVYRSLSGSDSLELWIPFRDATNGRQTYGAGRYVDVERAAETNAETGRLIVDFNYAYNPTCAYNPAFNCPLPPQRNWLPLAVRAGEQTPALGAAE